MTSDELAEEIYQLIELNGGDMTIQELRNRLGEHVNGGYEFTLSNNVLLFSEISKKLCEILVSIVKGTYQKFALLDVPLGHAIFLCEVYHKENGSMIPFAKTLRNYKALHQLPCMFKIPQTDSI